LEPTTITKEDLTAWLQSLSGTYEVLAPVTKEGVTKFTALADPASIDLGVQGPAGTLRECFTPETETLFEYKISGQSVEIEDGLVEQKDRLIFGARACDAAALKYVDAVYSMVQPRDEQYFNRREHTVIAGVFCGNPAWSCFCTEVNDYLANPIEMDLLFTDIGDKYYVQAFTPKGEEIAGASQFQSATADDTQAAEAARQKTLDSMPKRADHEEACLKFDWDHPIFKQLSQKCLGCGICAFNCPTCHCFDIQECAKGTCGSRFRCWDTCQFEKFTLMGHGHNPRPSRQERTRQRVFHKFNYSIERYGMLGCVGCGRCISMCPVNIDIKQVVGELEKTVAEPEEVAAVVTG